VSTDNDAPQVFSDDTGADGFSGDGWRSGPGDAGPASATRHDEAAEAAEADPHRPWSGWGAVGHPQPSWPAEGEAYPAGSGYPPRAEPDYPAESGYPVPEYPAEPDYPPEAGYPSSGYRPEAEYPSGPGYAPLPADYPDLVEPGYPAGPGYRSDPGNAHEQGYPDDGWVVPEPRLAGDIGYPAAAYGPEAGSAPPMASRPGSASQPMARPSPGWMPPALLDPPGSARTPDNLSAESLLHGKRPASGSGWRHRVFRMTGGLLRLSESVADIRRHDLINRVRTPVAAGHHRVAVLSLKGGVGKTTIAVGLGATLATLRGDRIVAVDANPDRGTLSDKVRLETAATIRDLLNERDQIRRYADIRAFTTQAPSRLEVLASDRDPAVSVAFSAEDYCDAALVLEHFYSICLTDCGTGLLHSAMSGVLGLADQIVVASSPSVDGARSASATLDWLEAHGYEDLVSNGIVVLSAIRPKSKSTVDLDRLEQHFAARCRAVARIPYDPHLEEGAEVELELLTAETADAFLTLAALVGDGLAWPRRLTSRSALP
jgi:MinD-like ATPase involved in chromosome partitioning or flagellar assembly